MKKHNDKKVILLGILGFLLIIGIVIGYSSAYFVASVVNKTPSQEALESLTLIIELKLLSLLTF